MNTEQIIFTGIVLWVISHFVIGHFVSISGGGDVLILVTINILLILYYRHCIRVERENFS